MVEMEGYFFCLLVEGIVQDKNVCRDSGNYCFIGWYRLGIICFATGFSARTIFNLACYWSLFHGIALVGARKFSSSLHAGSSGLV